MWPGPFFPPSDLVGTMTTKSYCLVVTASSLTGRQVPSALHVPQLRPGIRTGERTHLGLGGGPVRVRTHPDGATRGLARHPGSPGPWHDGPRTNQPKTCLPEKCETKLAEMLPVEVFLENICHNDSIFLAVPMEENLIATKKHEEQHPVLFRV